jgi:uncharacterized repeat protein (TIGR03803 family)
MPSPPTKPISLAKRPVGICATAFVVFALLYPSALLAQNYTVLHVFGSEGDGRVPFGAPTLDGKGHVLGTTASGGSTACQGYGCGTIFALTHETSAQWHETILHAFTNNGDGADPEGNLVLDRNGHLYGTVAGEGPGQAAVFEMSDASKKLELSQIYQQYASSGLLLDAMGNLYGFFGLGDLGSGAIGVLSPGDNGWTYIQLYSFCSPLGGCSDGVEPRSPLSWDSKGNLYGTTLYGGVSTLPCPGSLGCGVAFQMTPNGDGTWTYHVMHRFASTQTDGQYPDSGLVVDAAGNAYGVAGQGGANGTGTIFKLTPGKDGNWTQTVLYEFPNCANGCFPDGTMVFDKAGNLYGVASGGLQDCGYTCGVVFRLARQAKGEWKYSTIHKFTGADGGFPWGVVLDRKGNLFGTTENGGTYNSGVAFEITP